MWIAIGIVGGVMLLVFTISLVTYIKVFHSPQKNQNNPHRLIEGEQYDSRKDEMLRLIDDFLQTPYKKVTIVGYRGVKLSAKYYYTAENAPLAICFHGYRGIAERDFCGGAPLLIREGMNVLLVDQRAHGKSGGHTISFGIKEKYDCLLWTDFAVRNFGKDVKILLFGVSMGAATVLMASNLDLPKNVRGIVADCPYSSPKDIVLKVCRDKRLPAKLLYPFIWLGGVLFGRFNLSGKGANKAVKNAKVPALIIHGEDDRYVPCEMSREIHAANKQMTQLETFPQAGHGLSYLIDPERYEKVVMQFAEQCLEI